MIFVVVVMVFRRGIMGELGPLLHRIWKSSQRAESLPTGSSLKTTDGRHENFLSIKS